jgi:biopolymer transport protein ExbD
MAFIPPPRRAPFAFNLTPMIDVTFQLLIFFVCANTWSHTEAAEELPLPAPIASGRDPARSERPRVTVTLRADGTLAVAGRDLAGPERLEELLRAEYRRHGDRLEVVLRAHTDVPYARTQEVFRACRNAGLRQVRFAVLRER